MNELDVSVYSLDYNLGNLVSSMRHLNIFKDTFIIYTSTNGYFMGEHGMYDKRLMYEESMHIPLIMVNEEFINYNHWDYPYLVTNLDIAPTILDVAGITPSGDANLHGKSLRSTWVAREQ